jgi:hypothetical protein
VHVGRLKGVRLPSWVVCVMFALQHKEGCFGLYVGLLGDVCLS